MRALDPSLPAFHLRIFSVQHSNKTSPLPPATTSTYQQFQGLTTPFGGYSQGGPIQAPQASYQPNQQYGIPPPHSQYHQNHITQQGPQQPFSGSPVAAPFGNPPYQALPNGQYPGGIGTPQYGLSPGMNAPQQYGAQQHGLQQAPAPYQAPPPSYPPHQQNGTYSGHFSQPPATFQGPPQQQWNNMNPSQQARGAPPYQRQQRSYSDAIYPSSTPGFHLQSPPSSQGHGRAPSVHRNIQSPIAPSNRNQQTNPSQTTPVSSISQSSGSNTSFNQPGNNTAVKRSNLETSSQSAGRVMPDEDEDRLTEDQQFAWDMAWIFMDAPPKETVRLAFPLSISFAVTPVPLLNAESTAPVSRFLKDVDANSFSRSVRDALNWSVLKVDPAFAEIDLDSPLIPIDEVKQWMAKRQGIIEDNPEASRKRNRSGEPDLQDHQGYIDDETTNEADVEPQDQGPPSKRPRNEKSDQAISEKEGTPSIPIPVHAAIGGTPCLESDDNAWAPEPGERACSPAAPDDDREVLLASLGVTGAPKPVSQEPLESHQPLEDMQVTTDQHLFSAAPKNRNTGQRLPVSHQMNEQRTFRANIKNQQSTSNFQPFQNGRHHNRAIQNGTPQYGPPQQARPQYGPSQNGQSTFPQYQTSPPHQVQQQQPQFQPQANHQYENGPPNNAAYENFRYGSNLQQPYSNGNHGPPQPGYSEPTQYGNGVNGHPQHIYPNPNSYENGINGPPQQMNYSQQQYGNNVTNNGVNGAPHLIDGNQNHYGNSINWFSQHGTPVQYEYGNTSNGHNQNGSMQYGPPPNQAYPAGIQANGPGPQNQRYGSDPGSQKHPNYDDQSPYIQGPRYHNNQSGDFGSGNQSNISEVSKDCIPYQSYAYSWHF
jgi:hypothetical protein